MEIELEAIERGMEKDVLPSIHGYTNGHIGKGANDDYPQSLRCWTIPKQFLATALRESVRTFYIVLTS